MKRLDLDDPKVWDRWRELYYELTPEENIQFGDDIEARFPRQENFNPNPFEDLFRTLNQVVGRVRVLEIGGWKGELALHCFSRFDIFRWHNIDMCKAAVTKTLPALLFKPYLAEFPYDFDWFKAPRVNKFDVCVSAHAIEHLSDDHLLDLIKHISGIPTVQFEAPISMTGQSWDGYEGTHMLRMGWNSVNAAMRAEGYTETKINEICFRYDLEVK